MVEVVYPKFLNMLEKGLESNGGKYFVGNAVGRLISDQETS